jgi:DNA-directed RNA polymerase subunit RPC12/RpoP
MLIKPLYKNMIEKTIHCPQCGDALDIYFKWTKLLACHSCGSSIFLEDESVKRIGEASVLSPEPSLLALHDPIIIYNKRYLPLGKVRYAYGRGFWEEWFLKGEDNREYWLSIDEGDFVLEYKTTISLPFKSFQRVEVGKKYGQYMLSEKGKGTCVGFEGELPKTIEIGKVHHYLHLSKGGGNLVTVEYGDGNQQTFIGKWIDPLAIKRVYDE